MISWAFFLAVFFAGLGFHVWDPGRRCGGLIFFALQFPYMLARLIIKEIEVILKLNFWWFVVKDSLSSLLEFLLIFFPCNLVEIIFYCFNASCFTGTKIGYIYQLVLLH